MLSVLFYENNRKDIDLGPLSLTCTYFRKLLQLVTPEVETILFNFRQESYVTQRTKWP